MRKIVIACAAAMTAAAVIAGCGGGSDDIVSSSAHPWMNASMAPQQRATLLVSAMTLPQKLEQLVGSPGVVKEIPACYGSRHIPGIPELQIPTLRITNGPVGVGQNDCVSPTLPGLPLSSLSSPASAKATALPSGMAVAASFDRSVAAQFGDVIGREANNLALQVLEGPGMNLARNPTLGRNFEYFGEDPVLSGTMGVAEIKAIQSHGVIAMAKHLVANEQETNRMTINENIDDKVLHELYMLPFEMAVKDGQVASVMCSYNSVNGFSMCENKHILTDVLRGQWGFTGYVQSDFFASHGTASTMLAGLDNEMPGINIPGALTTWWTADRLNAALAAGQIKVSDIDTALTRRYTQMFRLGIFDRPVAQTPIDQTGDGVIARSIGEQAAVLLKNDNSLLPFDAKTIHSVALIGQAAYATKAVSGCCGGSSDVIPLYTVTPLQGVQNALAKLGSSATATLTVVADDNSNLADAVTAAKAADVVIVLAGTIAEEGADRTSIALSNNQDAIAAAIAAANPRTAVVMKDNASSLMPWIDSVPAVLETWFPGQEDGNIAAELLFGIATPSGKLPVTFPKNAGDWPANTPAQYPGVNVNGVPTVTYSEGLDIGYRWYDAQNVKPLFPFGYGLSYTTFALSNLQVAPQASDGTVPITVQVDVENTGKARGAEVPQVYLSLPAGLGQPPKRLVAFQKVWLNPGEKQTVKLTIDPNATSHPLGAWDTHAQQWTTTNGQYQVLVGNSSQNPALVSAISIGK
ncbi:glycoside hydrolase family 3 C-terminal domain-containing protein [Burkholderia sp. Ac-20353]|uniref:beta-glucosidase n=1 Tax=Burkholderia sp. Ac-20353 TaxID=2703894 RepID=UPI00197C862F|nr:glycoside hydrolase family 3 C-terminal domain-containing protein [Burkholderia sp. Ac-20353]MBN3790956.1 glycosyl hydrolase [Burkholderia sp. Ac-20353]